MAKKQTRRSISHRAEVYVTVERVAEERGLSVSAYVEGVLRDRWQLDGVVMTTRADALRQIREPKPQPVDVEKVASSIFTF